MNSFKTIRTRLQMTQTGLAEALGITQGNVSFYERGQTVPPHIARRLIQVAAHAGHQVTFDDIYGDAATNDTPPGATQKAA